MGVFMDWIQVLTIIGTVVGIGAWIHSDVRMIENRLDTHITAINARTDQLYIALIEIIKQQKDRK